jgi:hypothetical protein
VESPSARSPVSSRAPSAPAPHIVRLTAGRAGGTFVVLLSSSGTARVLRWLVPAKTSVS